MTTSFKALFDLTGRTAVVTGGCGILGRHFANGLAEFASADLAVTFHLAILLVFRLFDGNEMSTSHRIQH